MFLDIFVFIVMAVLLAAIAFIAVKLGALPGKIARSRNHPQAEAINVCAWLGLITLGLAWPIALVWAYTRPAQVAVTDEKGNGEITSAIGEISERLRALEKKVSNLTTQEGGGTA
jgi:type VI protein secretion system component VasK